MHEDTYCTSWRAARVGTFSMLVPEFRLAHRFLLRGAGNDAALVHR